MRVLDWEHYDGVRPEPRLGGREQVGCGKAGQPLTVRSVQEDSLNVADLTSLRAPLDIPIPDPPPKDDEVRYSGCRVQTINPVEMMALQPP